MLGINALVQVQVQVFDWTGGYESLVYKERKDLENGYLRRRDLIVAFQGVPQSTNEKIQIQQ